MKRKINFTIHAERVSIKFEIDPNLNPGSPHMSLTGQWDGGGGQIDTRLGEKYGHFPEIAELCRVWLAYHLKKPTKKGQKEINSALDALNGKRLGSLPDLDEAPEVDENADTLDSSDVIKRIEVYAGHLVAAGVALEGDGPGGVAGVDVQEVWEEYNALKNLEDACSYGDWEYGVTLIAESHFQDFAEEEAESIGAINRDTHWPNNHIDWEAAAEELKGDYSQVTFKGNTFWFRS